MNETELEDRIDELESEVAELEADLEKVKEENQQLQVQLAELTGFLADQERAAYHLLRPYR